MANQCTFQNDMIMLARRLRVKCVDGAFSKCGSCGATMKTHQDALRHFCNPYAPEVSHVIDPFFLGEPNA